MLSSKDLPPKKNDFKMYDAVLSPDSAPDPVDSEMEKFMPMLNDYLKRERYLLLPSLPQLTRSC